MKRGRTTIIAVLIVALLATGAAQMLVQHQREKMHPSAARQQSTSSLSRMDSYALALLLGGLRGPLVMFLWTQSESQKGNKDLQGIDTQIEWIRLLQPEFDTVHLFQIWNKAYNLSVQMAAMPNKYAMILDAIDYAQSVDRERPDGINIISQMGTLYGDKLGGSREKDYYRRRVRQDSAYSASREKRGIFAPGERRSAMPMLVGADGNLLAEYLSPRLDPPLSAALPVPQTYDGAELEYLKEYQPFPYGVSTLALAYNYYKRAQVLRDLTGQQPIQMSGMVADGRPALTLLTWATEEWEFGSRSEVEAWGLKPPYDRLQLEGPTAGMSLTSLSPEQLAGNAKFDEAVFCYTRALLCLDNSEKEYRRHLGNPQFAGEVERYRWQREQIAACHQLLTGDLAFLKAMRCDGKDREAQVAIARDAYRLAARLFKVIRLRYFVQDDIRTASFPPGMTTQNLEQMTDAQVDAITREVERRVRQQGFDYHVQDAAEYIAYVQRCVARLTILK